MTEGEDQEEERDNDILPKQNQDNLTAQNSLKVMQVKGTDNKQQAR